MSRPEIVFRETDQSFVRRLDENGQPLGEWQARALMPVADRETGEVHRGVLVTIREDRGGWFRWKTYGATGPGGNRYHEASSLNEAQERVQRWAQRRFRPAEEVES